MFFGLPSPQISYLLNLIWRRENLLCLWVQIFWFSLIVCRPCSRYLLIPSVVDQYFSWLTGLWCNTRNWFSISLSVFVRANEPASNQPILSFSSQCHFFCRNQFIAWICDCLSVAPFSQSQWHSRICTMDTDWFDRWQKINSTDIVTSHIHFIVHNT